MLPRKDGWRSRSCSKKELKARQAGCTMIWTRQSTKALKLLTAYQANRELCGRVKRYFHLLRTDRWGYLEISPGEKSVKKLFAQQIDQTVAEAIKLRSELRRHPRKKSCLLRGQDPRS